MSRLLALFVTLLLAPACDPESIEPRDDLSFTRARVSLLGPLSRSDEGRQILEDASQIIGVILEPVEPDEPTYGTLSLTVIPDADGEATWLGSTPHSGGPNPICYRSSWCYADPVVCAHEIGHMLGLDESSSGGLMDSSEVVHGGSLELRAFEREELEARAESLSRCQ